MRKLLFAVLILVSLKANAVRLIPTEAEWKKLPSGSHGLCLPNDAGGHIVLTSRPAPNNQKGSLLVFATSPKGGTTTGAWTTIGQDTVIIQWDSSRTSTFRMGEFYFCSY